MTSCCIEEDLKLVIETNSYLQCFLREYIQREVIYIDFYTTRGVAPLVVRRENAASTYEA